MVGTERPQDREHARISHAQRLKSRLVALDLTSMISVASVQWSPLFPQLQPFSACSSDFHFAASRHLHSFPLTKFCENAEVLQFVLLPKNSSCSVCE